MEFITTYQPVIATVAGIAALLILILRAKMNAFAALLLVAILSAVASGMSPEGALNTVTKGMGGVLGFIAPVIGLGALFGIILEASGGIQTLANGTAKLGSSKRQKWAMGFLGLIAATPVFFDVALIILMPFIAGLAKKSGKVALYFGLPLCAGLAVGHAFIPPTPGPIAIAELIGANLGWVLLFGSLTGLICMAVAGPVLTGMLQKRNALPVGDLKLSDFLKGETEPPVTNPMRFQTAIGLILLPLTLIVAGTLSKFMLPSGIAQDIFTLIGHPFSALLIASGACWVCARRASVESSTIQSAMSRAFEPTGVVILVTGAGGAFKQVLVDTGAGEQIANGVLSIGLTPILMAFVLALIIRAAQGSATVAMITAAGLIAPILATMSLSDPQLALITIAIAAGASGLSYVNDSGFWLVSRLFGISEKETLATWTVSTTLIAVTGLTCTLILYPFVG
jgi:Gnt-I system low-affinity gluconate transporter